MNTFLASLWRVLCTLVEWFLSVVAMLLVIIIGELIAATLLFVTTLLFPGLELYGVRAVLASFDNFRYLFLFCPLVGCVVGSFRSLWARRETGHHHLVPMIVVNTLALGVGLPLMYFLSNSLPNLFPTLVGCTFSEQDMGICWMDSNVFLVVGLIYGLVFGIVLGLAEWLALGRRSIRLWMWLSVSACAWVLWCGVIMEALSSYD